MLNDVKWFERHFKATLFNYTILKQSQCVCILVYTVFVPVVSSFLNKIYTVLLLRMAISRKLTIRKSKFKI